MTSPDSVAAQETRLPLSQPPSTAGSHHEATHDTTTITPPQVNCCHH